MATQGHATVQARGVRLVHASAGRIRLKVDDIRGNPDRARDIEARLRALTGVHTADANPLTGSLLLTYDESALQSMELPFSVAQVLGISLNDLDPSELRRLMSHHGNGVKQMEESLAGEFESAMRDVNAAVRQAVGVDLGIVLPLLLAALGVRSLMVSEKTVFPSWHDYFWFAFSTYFMLNRPPSAR